MPRPKIVELLLAGRTPFGKHPVFSHASLERMLAEEMELQERTAAQAAENLVSKGVITRELADALLNTLYPPHMLGLEHRIQRIEAKHKDELVDLAKQTVAALYGVSKDEIASLMSGGVRLEGQPIPNAFRERAREKLTERVKKWIDKRHVHNLAISGIAVNHMRAASIMARGELEKIDSALPDLHALHSALAQLLNFKHGHEVVEAGSAPPLVAGTMRLEWKDGKPSASARAVTFPILVQEISKAVAEAAFAHGLPKAGQLAEEEINAFHNRTNDPANEVIHFLAGPPTAALLQKAIGSKDALSHFAAFSVFPHEDLTRHVTRLLDSHGNPSKIEARGRLIRLDAAETRKKWVDGEEFEV